MCSSALGKSLLHQPGTFLLASMDILLSSRPPLEYLKPFDKPTYKRLDGIIEPDRNYCSLFESGPPPERPKVENPRERKEREWKEKTIEHIKKIREESKDWNPKGNPKATHDPYKTLFVCRLNKNISEAYLKQVFEDYGAVRKVVLVKDRDGKSRNYAFVEFEKTDEYIGLVRVIIVDAYKHANNKKLNGLRIRVDYERGRTREDWRPRRFGGGKGRSRTSRRDEERLAELLREIDEEENMLRQDEDEGVKGDSPGQEEQKRDSPVAKRKERSEERPKERSESRGRRRSRSRAKDHKRKQRDNDDHHKRREKRHRSRERGKDRRESRRDRSKERREDYDR
eukprot:TRINITY_DN2885_c0_g1_i4.p1 TRINITY_DN2885_c0_g1~~TRINITY_DN2885_c0_g1_i4.p1  ORF type:complete len:340 (+),score=91.00 TRINITY_DN2885_c0_g1_i4:195-1214(+)